MPIQFSIITVCRNNETTIARTIESVNAQQDVKVQHIFVDGASTDGTLDLISRVGAANRIVISEPDKGIYDAMNKGLNLAHGEIIGLLNADDYYNGNLVLSKVARAFEVSGKDCVFGDIEFFKAAQPDKVIRHYDSGRFTPQRLKIGMMPAHPATFFRKQVYDQLGQFKTDYKISADFEFIARAFKTGKLPFVYIPEVLVRMQSGGVSSRGIKSKYMLNMEVLRALRENGIASSPFHLLAKIPLRLLELLK